MFCRLVVLVWLSLLSQGIG